MTTASQPGAAPAHRDDRKVLEVKDLRVHYGTARGDVIAVNGVSFDVYGRETLGLVGESGCGKSTTAMSILRLIQPPGRVVSGEVRLEGTDLLALSESQLRERRWQQISLIPQGSMNSLNPIMRVRDQMADGILAHEKGLRKNELRDRIYQLLEDVNLPRYVYDMYPHELSGGMKQRVCIAMAIALKQSLIIADEPTSALDVVVQRIVAQTLMDVKERLGMSMILIGHDMGLQAQMVDRIAVMYAGNILEIAPVADLFSNPVHPYTQRLIASVPSIKERKPLIVNEEMTPDLRKPRPVPQMREVGPRHWVAMT